LRACETSGKGIAAYAADHGLDARAMYTGKKVLVKKGVLPRTRVITPFLTDVKSRGHAATSI